MEISSFESVGSLRFGDLRQDIRKRLVGNYVTFKKDVGENDTDAYNELGLHLYYNKQDRLEFVEIFEPAQPQFRGILFIGRDVSDVSNDLKKLGFSTESDEVGLNCPEAGIGLTASDGIIEGVAVFRKGYYDE